VRHEEKFVIDLPQWLEPMPTLATDAQFKYGNTQQNLFVLVRYDSLAALQRRYPRYTLEDYYDYHLANLIEPMRDAAAPTPDTMQIHGHSALLGTFTGTFKKDDLFFQLMVMRHGPWLYQVLLWMPVERQKKNEAWSTQVMRSFTPL
jgi:hypothetical protein